MQNWLTLGMGIVLACFGISLVVTAFRKKGHQDCDCADYDLDDMDETILQLESAVSELKLATQPVTAARIDEFLGDPSTGVRRERPTRPGAEPL